jgi:hypothetical protein
MRPGGRHVSTLLQGGMVVCDIENCYFDHPERAFPVDKESAPEMAH